MRPCPLCHGLNFRPLSRTMQFHHDLTTVVCRSCSFVFTNPVPTRKAYESFYDETYERLYGEVSALPPDTGDAEEPEYVRRRFSQIARFVSLQNRTLLEVGPGNGQFLSWAQRRGCTVLGLDPSPEFVNRLTSRGLPCVQGTLGDVEGSFTTPFDIVAALHVIEHMYDPNEAFVACRNVLADGGLLLVEVPNILKPFRSLDHYFLRFAHLSSFSPGTLPAFLEKHGFQILFIDNTEDDWLRPRNLFVIGQKIECPGQWRGVPAQSYRNVLLTLWGYRLAWATWRGPYWRCRSFVRRAARKVGRLLQP